MRILWGANSQNGEFKKSACPVGGEFVKKRAEKFGCWQKEAPVRWSHKRVLQKRLKNAGAWWLQCPCGEDTSAQNRSRQCRLKQMQDRQYCETLEELFAMSGAGGVVTATLAELVLSKPGARAETT